MAYKACIYPTGVTSGKIAHNHVFLSLPYFYEYSIQITKQAQVVIAS